ncbi:MAG: ABC transporter ATP-binding protein [Acidimicrobiales bacterium]|jgi:iron complex transport system ATP-binding protein|nr:ABC transporter ATP-binding protein [Acidimicrobiales bacterium]MDP6280343.1 ABC transporter ATP-binding protein [Acidimicrobiales bacterium]MDP7117962.1 ABC transporter ATP-binding protein [Acidimicrobiales bacterium]MDP7410172.1 ABC transporter ATP-binding protein [Acidimicrobiales bacterium]MEE1521503.1 ABC transporter ATP-binding protein [Acidimicrobiales bacterium]|tara:strand:- start:5893 stop:6669 length:777 start_codon:yes stop_codon:yes gene_type:complete
MTTVACRSITVSLDGVEVLRGVDLDVPSGGWVTVVGPNGAGKSTLLRAVAGSLTPGGEVLLDSRPVRSLSRRETARLVALVPQEPVIPPGMRVLDYVLLGRTAHLGFFEAEGMGDVEMAVSALHDLDAGHLAGRTVDTLSGGERQRVVIARALAQESPVLLLDEPTTALDIGHQQEVLDLVDGLRSERNLTVLATMHDLTLAGQYADRLVMLDGGLVAASGPAAEVLTGEAVSRHYGVRVRVIDDEVGPIVVPVRRAP